MARKEILENIPADRVAEVVSEFKAEGATVTKKKENGTFSVTAVFPDETDDDDADSGSS